MLTKMTEEKSETTSQPAIVMVEKESTDPPKRRMTKKYVIIGATVILTLAIILAAILIGMYFFTQAQKDILKFKMKMDKNTDEDVTAYRSSNVIQYHVSNVNYEMWVIQDYNKDIEVLKVQTQSSTNCYVHPLNKTTNVDVSKLKLPTNTDIKTENSSETLNYVVLNTPIADASFLSKQAKDECKGISTYWMYPKCDNDQVSPDKEKRSLVCYTYKECCRSCLFIFCCKRCWRTVCN